MPVKDTAAMISGMNPKRQPGEFIFATVTVADDPLKAAAKSIYEEAEGTSLILPVDVAEAQGFDVSMPMACLTLQVNSALDGVGLTAAVATALAEAGIPCNMVAAFHHDHAYVPAHQADDALACLEALSKEGGSAPGLRPPPEFS